MKSCEERDLFPETSKHSERVLLGHDWVFERAPLSVDNDRQPAMTLYGKRKETRCLDFQPRKADEHYD